MEASCLYMSPRPWKPLCRLAHSYVLILIGLSPKLPKTTRVSTFKPSCLEAIYTAPSSKTRDHCARSQQNREAHPIVSLGPLLVLEVAYRMVSSRSYTPWSSYMVEAMVLFRTKPSVHQICKHNGDTNLILYGIFAFLLWSNVRAYSWQVSIYSQTTIDIIVVISLYLVNTS